MIATSGFVTALRAHQICFSAGAPPRTPLGELTAPPNPLAGLTEPTSKGEGEKGHEKGKRRAEE